MLNVNGESLTEQQINLLYNACDVGINTSMGEGWGLISFEHGATGAAQIVPAHTSFIENWTGAADLLRVIGPNTCGANTRKVIFRVLAIWRASLRDFTNTLRIFSKCHLLRTEEQRVQNFDGRASAISLIKSFVSV